MRGRTERETSAQLSSAFVSNQNQIKREMMLNEKKQKEKKKEVIMVITKRKEKPNKNRVQD